MPEQDESLTASGWPAAGKSGNHPVLREVADAARQVANVDAFLSPTRMFDEPHLEESDWPRDLDGPETREVLGHLAAITCSLDACVMGIRSTHNVPDSAKPELDSVSALLHGAGRKLNALTEEKAQGPDSASPAQQARQSFPQPQAGPVAVSDQPTARPAKSRGSVKPRTP